MENSETDSSAASHRYKSQSGRNNEPAVSRKAHKSKLTPQKSHAIGKSSPKIENSAGEPNRTRRPVMKTFQDDEGFMGEFISSLSVSFDYIVIVFFVVGIS